MRVRNTTGDGWPHLPDLVNGLGVTRNLQFGEEPHDAAGGLGARVPNIKGDLGLRDGPDVAYVVGLDGHGPVVGFESKEGL